MSTTRRVWIVCDHCDEDHTEGYGEASANEARAVARAAGWHRHDGADICPSCWDEGFR